MGWIEYYRGKASYVDGTDYTPIHDFGRIDVSVGSDEQAVTALATLQEQYVHNYMYDTHLLLARRNGKTQYWLELMKQASGAYIPKKVIFHDPATIVYWSDGSKTVVKCQPGDTYSKEMGLALCISKKALGNKSNFNNIFKKWIPEENE